MALVIPQNHKDKSKLKPDDRRILELQYIKSTLALIGLRCADLDKNNKLKSGTCSEALYRANKRGEKAISEALETPAHKLWYDRYDQKSGERYNPQPRENYNRPPTLKEIQKSRAA